MNDIFKLARMAPTICLTALLILFGANMLSAGPPLPDDPTTEGDTDYESLIQDQLLRFSEDYVDLIDELEAVLDEFEEFFEEFGQTSITKYEKAVKKLRATLAERYSKYH
jgi:hypothetical protein